jgi:hypothetical protein
MTAATVASTDERAAATSASNHKADLRRWARAEDLTGEIVRLADGKARNFADNFDTKRRGDDAKPDGHRRRWRKVVVLRRTLDQLLTMLNVAAAVGSGCDVSTNIGERYGASHLTRISIRMEGHRLKGNTAVPPRYRRHRITGGETVEAQRSALRHRIRFCHDGGATAPCCCGGGAENLAPFVLDDGRLGRDDDLELDPGVEGGRDGEVYAAAVLSRVPCTGTQNRF